MEKRRIFREPSFLLKVLGSKKQIRRFGLCISLIAGETEVPRYMFTISENMVLPTNHRFIIR